MIRHWARLGWGRACPRGRGGLLGTADGNWRREMAAVATVPGFDENDPVYVSNYQRLLLVDSGHLGIVCERRTGHQPGRPYKVAGKRKLFPSTRHLSAAAPPRATCAIQVRPCSFSSHDKPIESKSRQTRRWGGVLAPFCAEARPPHCQGRRCFLPPAHSTHSSSKENHYPLILGDLLSVDRGF